LFACLTTILFSFAAFAQGLKPVPAAVQQHMDQGGEFYPSQMFLAKSLDKNALDAVEKGQGLQLLADELAYVLREQPQGLVLVLPYLGETIQVRLVKADILAPDFSLTSSASGGRAIPVPAGAHYRGSLVGDPNSLASFSFFEGEVMGMVSDALHGDRVLGKVEGRSDYIFYADRFLKAKNPFTCGTPDDKLAPGEPQPHGNIGTPEVNGCVRVYLEADNELYVNKGSSVTNTNNYLTGVFNQMATLYANETISTVISQIFVWTTPDSYSNSSSSTALSQFRSARPTFNGNLAHLASLGGNNLGGVAYLSGLCTTNSKYAYSNINASYQNVPTYSWTVMVMTHEMGHNLGSRHTQWCGWSGGAIDNCFTTEGGCSPGPPPVNGGTIMSYCHLTSNGINLANGFGPQPGNVIRNSVSNASCLSATCSTGGGGGGGCGTPTNLTSSVSTTSATVSWSSVSGATSYNLQWKLASASTWTTISGITTTSRNLTGLIVGTAYNFQVQANCNGTLGSYSAAATFTTALSSCGTPGNLSVSSITATSATLNWNAVSGASSYNLLWKTASAMTWQSINNVIGTSRSLTGLVAATSYTFQVQANCNGSLGVYSGTANFTTTGQTGCPDTYESNNTLNTAKVVPVNTNLTAVIGSATDEDWFRFSNTNTTRNIKVDLSNLPADYNIELRRNSSLLATSANTGTTNESLIFNTSTVSSSYYVRVFSAAGAFSTAQCYTLRISLGSTPWSQESSGERADEAVLQLDLPVVEEAGFSMFPNPADDLLVVDVPVDMDDTPVDISVLDLSGKSLLQEQPVFSRDAHRQNISLGTLPNGVYLVQVQHAGQRHMRKLVVQH
jgi:hypothetical protein